MKTNTCLLHMLITLVALLGCEKDESKILAILEATYLDSKSALNYDSIFQLMVAKNG